MIHLNKREDFFYITTIDLLIFNKFSHVQYFSETLHNDKSENKLIAS